MIDESSEGLRDGNSDGYEKEANDEQADGITEGSIDGCTDGHCD